MEWYEDNQQGKPPPAGGMADERPTAPELSAALLRMKHHTQMAVLSRDEMTRGPGNKRWGIIERLDDRDIIVFIDAAFEAIRLAAAIVAGNVHRNADPGDERRPAGSESSARRPRDRPAGNQRDSFDHPADRHTDP